MQVASWARDYPEITSIPWKRLAVEVFHLEATPAVVSRMRRAYRDWRLHSVEGSLSSVGAGASRKTTRRRAVSDAPLRNTKAPCLMFELMTWFVDFCLGWRVRSRRARIAMRHASGRSDPPTSVDIRVEDAVARPREGGWLCRPLGCLIGGHRGRMHAS